MKHPGKGKVAYIIGAPRDLIIRVNIGLLCAYYRIHAFLKANVSHHATPLIRFAAILTASKIF